MPAVSTAVLTNMTSLWFTCCVRVAWPHVFTEEGFGLFPNVCLFVCVCLCLSVCLHVCVCVCMCERVWAYSQDTGHSCVGWCEIASMLLCVLSACVFVCVCLRLCVCPDMIETPLGCPYDHCNLNVCVWESNQVTRQMRYTTLNPFSFILHEKVFSGFSLTLCWGRIQSKHVRVLSRRITSVAGWSLSQAMVNIWVCSTWI